MLSGASLPNVSFSSLPLEIIFNILPHIDEQSMSSFASSSKQNQTIADNHYLYFKKILSLGVEEKYLKQVVPCIQHFRLLYHAIKQLPRSERSTLRPWSLCCLSNEDYAIQYAKDHFRLHADKRDDHLRSPIHFFCLTRTPERLINSMQLLNVQPSHLRKLDYKHRSMLHYGALSGSPDVLSYLLLLNFQLDETDICGADARHYAALSGHKKQIKFTLFKHEMDAEKMDEFKNSSMQYALLSPHPFFATEQVEKYQGRLKEKRKQLLSKS